MAFSYDSARSTSKNFVKPRRALPNKGPLPLTVIVQLPTEVQDAMLRNELFIRLFSLPLLKTGFFGTKKAILITYDVVGRVKVRVPAKTIENIRSWSQFRRRYWSRCGDWL